MYGKILTNPNEKEILDLKERLDFLKKQKPKKRMNFDNIIGTVAPEDYPWNF